MTIKSIKLNKILSLIIDVLLAALVIYALFEYCCDSIENILTNVHKFYEENSFSYFTTESNILVCIVCIISIPFDVLALVKKDGTFPKWLYVLKHVATVYVIITFLVVNLALVWLVDEPSELYEGKEIITHVVAPILSFVGFELAQPAKVDFKRELPFVSIPLIVYCIMYFLNVFIFKVWEDFYSVGFFYPYSVLIFLVGFLGVGALVAYLTLKFKKSA